MLPIRQHTRHIESLYADYFAAMPTLDAAAAARRLIFAATTPMLIIFAVTSPYDVFAADATMRRYFICRHAPFRRRFTLISLPLLPLRFDVFAIDFRCLLCRLLPVSIFMPCHAAAAALMPRRRLRYRCLFMPA